MSIAKELLKIKSLTISIYIKKIFYTFIVLKIEILNGNLVHT